MKRRLARPATNLTRLMRTESQCCSATSYRKWISHQAMQCSWLPSWTDTSPHLYICVASLVPLRYSPVISEQELQLMYLLDPYQLRTLDVQAFNKASIGIHTDHLTWIQVYKDPTSANVYQSCSCDYECALYIVRLGPLVPRATFKGNIRGNSILLTFFCTN